ncbi:MAG: hypothetical protein ACK5MP_06730 [Nostocoides sp.]
MIRGALAGDPLGELARAGSVGYQRILDLEPVTLDSLEIAITASRGPVAVSGVRATRCRPGRD